MILIGQYDSPFVRRVGITLALYGLPFEHRPWSVFADGENVRAFNPLMRVPTLVLADDQVLIDSAGMIDALDDLVGPDRALCPRSGPLRRQTLSVVALAMGAKWIHNLGETTHAPIDTLSVVLSAFGFGGLVYGLSQIGGAERHEGGDQAAASMATASLVVSLVVGVIALTVFVLRQLKLQKVDDALLDLRVFRSRNFTLAISQLALLSAAFFGVITVLPLYLQSVLGVSSLDTGLAVLPGSLIMGLAGPFIGRVYDARGTRTLLVPGAILAIGMLWFYAVFFNATTPLWVVVIAQTVLALGLALSFTPLFTASLASLEPRFYSYGSAIVGTAQQVAGAAGIAVMFTVMSAVTATATASGASETVAGAAGAHAAFLLAAVVSLPLLVGAFLIRKPEDQEFDAPPAH